MQTKKVGFSMIVLFLISISCSLFLSKYHSELQNPSNNTNSAVQSQTFFDVEKKNIDYKLWTKLVVENLVKAVII